jgi:ATP-dependent exoDNAse (exonuclease V) beta subunit
MDYPNLSYALFAKVTERVAGYERIRLLYVALTRAKQRLVVAGGRNASLAPPYENARNFAELLAPRARAADFETRAGKTLADDSDFFVEDDEGGEVLWRLLSEATLSLTASPKTEDAARSLTLPQILHDGERLAKLRQRAQERRARPFHRAASALELDVEAMQREAGGSASHSESAGASREAAQAVGTAIHAALEHYAFSLSAEKAYETLRQTARAQLPRLVPPEQLAEAESLCAGILDSLRGSELLQRLRELEPALLGREVPILTSSPADSALEPLGFCPGVVDLLYRDPDTGEVVVADYKTDRLEGAQELARRAHHYRQQGEIYCRALQQALPPQQRVRFELWFLRYDRIERMD